MSIDLIQSELQGRAMNFAGLNALVKFDFGAEGALFLDGRTTPPTVTKDGTDPDTTLACTTETFVKLGKGEIAPTMAFMMGKLKITGNMGIAMKLSSMLED
ncbi:MAG: hypothetical protein RLY86_3483 [Pseudomonadota bacterium]|jgi:putative sterol carrier protein